MEPLRRTNLLHVHVSGQAVLGYPSHVLTRSDVNLGNTIRGILVQHYGDLPGVDTPAHVLLVGTLQSNNISSIIL